MNHKAAYRSLRSDARILPFIFRSVGRWTMAVFAIPVMMQGLLQVTAPQTSAPCLARRWIFARVCSPCSLDETSSEFP